ncbi:FAD-dependent oxidoreductase [Streptomyces sp. NPDC051940]|uniref:FAD-dependent oxidoreductase n=1 Tax=Streptomyces sp. NPDC051940 TaxID=3155675 RepID=UPI0034155A3F
MPTSADLVVYGGTSAGIMAAVQMRRSGGSVVLLEPGDFLGGLTASGLGYTDKGNTASIGGIAAEFYRRVYAKYNGTTLKPTSPARFTFEPHVASTVFADMLHEARVPVAYRARLASVTKSGNRLVRLVTDGGTAYTGKMFVDATYEGDLMARAGVAHTTGREGNAKYAETLNGVQLRSGHQFAYDIDPYNVPGSPGSGLLPGVSAAALAPKGTGDGHVQAYNYRMCLTRASNRIPFPKPAGYDPRHYDLLLRYIQAGYPGPFFTASDVGGGKTDSNNYGAVSTDFIGGSDGYPTASFTQRQSIADAHRAWQQGLMWFLANDPRVPLGIRNLVGSYGLAADEFTGTGGWPPLMYVREGRRMVSAYVMTEHNCAGRTTAPDAVALASYNMDSHNCQRLVVDGVVRNEGDVQVAPPRPYPVSYRSIVPVESQCANLLVPCAVSASHIAYGSIRMEPVFMALAQSAAIAAKLAIETGGAVQWLSYPTLKSRLMAAGQLLAWPDLAPGEVIVDNAAPTGISTAGTWYTSRSVSGYYGPDFVHDGNTNKGTTRLRFRPSLATSRKYTVYLRWTAASNRATNVPVDIVHAGGTTTKTVNQRLQGGQWVSLGSYSFAAGTTGSVLIRTSGTNGYVIADAVRFTPS